MGGKYTRLVWPDSMDTILTQNHRHIYTDVPDESGSELC